MSLTKSTITPVILAGGSGTRLWPLSRSKHPKQFLNLINDKSLIQNTLERIQDLDTENPIIICNEDHRFLVSEQVRQLNLTATIILEPFSRNTAPAVELAAKLIPEDSLMLVLAADHVIFDASSFTDTINKAIPEAIKGRLITFGIEPTSAHTGYGYIRQGKKEGNSYKVEEFKEKPNKEKAKYYLESRSYFWNSGMFLFRSKDYSEELGLFRPEIAKRCKESLDNLKEDLDFLRIHKESFELCPNESIDYAVMENSEKASVVPLESDWADIGSWQALWEISPKDNENNVIYGDVSVYDTSDCYIRSDDKLVATLGVQDLIIASTRDAVFVARKDTNIDLKGLINKLQMDARSELELNREVFRPWGKFDSLSASDHYQVKKITVHPGEKLSVQLHNHRSEHWVVLSGEATVTIDENTFILRENESTYIPAKAVHSLENITESPLEIIEIQTGTYFGEDDIVRLEDRYGRIEEEGS